MKELLEKLTMTFGPSGYEGKVRDLILETVKKVSNRLVQIKDPILHQ